MLELHLIRLLLNKEAYNKYRRYVKPKQDILQMYNVLDDLHREFSRDISLQEYSLHARVVGCEFVDTLLESEIEEDSLSILLSKIALRNWAEQVAISAVDVSEGRQDISSLDTIYDSKEALIDEVDKEDPFITTSLEVLAKTCSRSSGIKWRLPELQELLGGLNKGDFGFIYARPETGKTTFLASEVSYFATQVDKPILWFNNEERGDKVMTRIYQASLGISLVDLYRNKVDNQAKFLNNTKGNIKLFDKGFINKREVERIVKEIQPSLIIFDQIDKIKGFKADRDDLLLGAIYVWARELAKEYCPVIGVCQASVSAEGKKWLRSDDIAKSKTEKYAEADFILGIGKSNDAGMDEIRFINVIKNKLTGLHPQIECRILAHIARYSEL
jgi:KaiC/GvpD/RAD55 family RecA-like ATPase